MIKTFYFFPTVTITSPTDRTSTSALSSIVENFGDGNTSTGQHPQHTYTSVGAYTVNHSTSKAAGTGWMNVTDIITVTGSRLPIVNFTVNISTGYTPLVVRFTNRTNCVQPTQWMWNFGDNSWYNTTTLSKRNATHTYTSPGSYTARLMVCTGSGSSVRCNTTPVGTVITVTLPGPITYYIYAEAAETGNVYTMARGFWDALKGSNQDGSATWVDSRGDSDIIGYQDATESHWTSDVGNWVEKGDFAYYSGHGSPNVFWFRNFTEYADASRIRLGSGKTKWAVIDACESLNYTTWQNWNPSFNGLHILLGWNTSTDPSFDRYGDGRGKIFAELMKVRYTEYNNTPMNIIDAWEWAGKYTWGIEPNTTDHDIFNAAIYDTNCWDDYLPGWIPGGHAICTSLSGTHSFKSVLIFRKNRESGAPKTSMGIVEDPYSVQASVPVTNNTVITYVPVKPGYTKEWASALARNLGMSGEIQETDNAFYAGEADSQQYYFEVRKDTSTIAFQKFDGRSGMPQSKASSIAAADAFLRKNGLLPSDTPKPEVLNNFAESISPTGERHLDWKTNVVTYPQMINGLPVFNAQFNIEVGSDNTIIGLWRNWQDYKPSQEISVKSPVKAFTEFKDRHNSIKKKMVTQTTVTSVSLGYIMHPSEVGEGYLQPVYIFEGDDRIGNTEESFGSVMIDAKEG